VVHAYLNQLLPTLLQGLGSFLKKLPQSIHVPSISGLVDDTASVSAA
jgi:hypothetical protein